MRKILFTVLFVYLFFIIEFSIYNYVHPLLMPNLILLLIIFTNLAFGIRYSLLAAVFGGCIKDSYVPGLFGIHMTSFVMCAFLTTLLIKNIYHKGSVFSRLLLVAIVTCVYVLINFTLYFILGFAQPLQALQYILVPEWAMTMLVTNPTIHFLRKCALRLFV